VKSLKLPIC